MAAIGTLPPDFDADDIEDTDPMSMVVAGIPQSNQVSLSFNRNLWQGWVVRKLKSADLNSNFPFFIFRLISV
jgi:hypothetical protein